MSKQATSHHLDQSSLQAHDYRLDTIASMGYAEKHWFTLKLYDSLIHLEILSGRFGNACFYQDITVMYPSISNEVFALSKPSFVGKGRPVLGEVIGDVDGR